MSGLESINETLESIGAQKLAALGERLRSRGIPTGNGPSFESLLARAYAADGASGTRADGASRTAATAATTTATASAGATVATGGSSQAAVFGRGGPGQAVVDAAMEYLGVPYLWGGTDEEHGFDCSGLVQQAYADIGVEMPKWSRHQATMGAEVPSIEDALPGDVIAFGEPVSHVGLYVGDGRMLHAPRTGEVVKVEEINRPIATIRRIVTPGGAPAALPQAGPPAGSLSGPSSLDAAQRAVAGAAVAAAPDIYQALFGAAGEEWGIDPDLLAAVARTESNFDPSAVSPVGAQGLMQFMPATAAEMGVDPWDPASAIDGAARYLRTSIDQFDTIEEAIASYNAGRGAVSRFGGVPPYPETQRYVQKVLAAWGEA